MDLLNIISSCHIEGAKCTRAREEDINIFLDTVLTMNDVIFDIDIVNLRMQELSILEESNNTSLDKVFI